MADSLVVVDYFLNIFHQPRHSLRGQFRCLVHNTLLGIVLYTHGIGNARANIYSSQAIRFQHSCCVCHEVTLFSFLSNHSHFE